MFISAGAGEKRDGRRSYPMSGKLFYLSGEGEARFPLHRRMGSQGSLAGTVPSSDSLGNPRQALGGHEVFALPLSLPALLSPLALPMASPGWFRHHPH